MDEYPRPDPDVLPEELIALVKPELEPGERLLWASRGGRVSSPSTAWRPSLGFWLWFSAFATTCLGSMIGSVAFLDLRREGIADVLVVVGVISGIIAFFFLVGLLQGIITTRAERRLIGGQVYALTDRRAVIWVPLQNSTASIHTFQRGTIRGEYLHRIQYPDGSGDVCLRGSFHQPSGFNGIAEVRRVEELVRSFLVVPELGPDLASDSEFD